MFNKKILVFPLFGMMIFVGSVAVMLLLGKFVTPPQPAIPLSVPETSESTGKGGKDETSQTSKIGQVIDELYYKEMADSSRGSGLDIKSGLFNNAEFADLVAEANKLKERYEARNAEITGREGKLEMLKSDLVAERKRLDSLKNELVKDLSMIKELKETLKKDMVVIDGEESKNMKLLASIYEGMKPKQAAAIINKMDHKTAVKILKLMDQRNSSKILQDIEPSTAVKLSERMMGNKGD